MSGDRLTLETRRGLGEALHKCRLSRDLVTKQDNTSNEDQAKSCTSAGDRLTLEVEKGGRPGEALHNDKRSPNPRIKRHGVMEVRRNSGNWMHSVRR